MDRALKERIIGAVVLVVIAVLVVPVFLDGPTAEREMISEPVLLPGQSSEPGARRTVVLDRDRDQPLPDAAMEGSAHPVEAAAERTAGAQTAAADERSAAADERSAPVDNRSAAEDDRSAPAGESGPSTPAGTAAGDPQDDAVADTAASPEPQEQDAPERVEETKPAPEKPAREPATAESATGMWAVQLGSFSNKANADRLAAKLRAEGYAAFLSEVETASGALHRVRIGPQKDRASAEAVAARLTADGLKGQVVPHP